MGRFIDLTGRVFGRLTVSHRSFTKNGKVYWACRCECGAETNVAGFSLKGGRSTSCGCWQKEVFGSIIRKHGLRNTKAYRALRGAITRCTNDRELAWKHYGGRGIRVSELWINDPEQFVADMGHPKPNETLERVDVNGHYEPGNCVWATHKQQGRNRRNNRVITYKGETKCLSEWTEIIGFDYDTLRFRLDQGWTVERAFETPLRRRSTIKERR